MDDTPYLRVLCDIFPHRRVSDIENIIDMVNENIGEGISEVGTFEEKIEYMVDLLSGDGQNVLYETSYDDQEGAVGYDSGITNWEVVLETLKEALPNACPDYLAEEAKKVVLVGMSAIENFVDSALENPDYPTLEDYKSKKREDDQLSLYKSDQLDIETFLKIFPSPEGVFQDPCRPNPLLEDDVPESDILCAKTFLYNNFPSIRKRHIDLVFAMKKKNLSQCCDMLNSIRYKGLKVPRYPIELPDTKNLPLLQEIAYLRHKKLIRMFVKYRDVTYRKFKENAKKLNLLENCVICDEELIPEECNYCQKGCVFCKDCLSKYVEVRVSDAILKFPCANDCDSQFTLHSIQHVMSAQTFAKVLLKIQSEEIKEADVDGVETCPFCDYTAIPPEGSIVFKCENEDCLKESCRQCRHESHIPKKCSEIEYDEDVRRRTYIEDKMTEALTRTCHKCKKKYVKTNGCNKMACTCGALMCYICSAAINGYEHFGAGRCPLFTNDNEINLNRIKIGAEQARNELGNVEIKFDPTVGIDQFY